MADGTTKPIERIRPGDKVLAVDHNNPRNSEPRPAEVARCFDNGIKPVVKVVFETSSEMLELHCTPEHLFYVVGNGWVCAGYLKKGDLCKSATGETIAFIRREECGEKVNVYNIEVEGAHTYFVGDMTASVLAHNECGGQIAVFGDDNHTETPVFYQFGPYTPFTVNYLELFRFFHWYDRKKWNNDEELLSLEDDDKNLLAGIKLKDRILQNT